MEREMNLSRREALKAGLLAGVTTMNAHWRDYDRLFTMPNP